MFEKASSCMHYKHSFNFVLSDFLNCSVPIKHIHCQQVSPDTQLAADTEATFAETAANTETTFALAMPQHGPADTEPEVVLVIEFACSKYC